MGLTLIIKECMSLIFEKMLINALASLLAHTFPTLRHHKKAGFIAAQEGYPCVFGTSHISPFKKISTKENSKTPPKTNFD
jgi:hypothetical protein